MAWFWMTAIFHCYSHTHKKKPKKRKKMSVCTVCGWPFVASEHIGVWACGQHAEPYDFETGKYPCCGAILRRSPMAARRGCVLADHNDGPARAEDGMPEPYNHRHDISTNDLVHLNPKTQRDALVPSYNIGGFFERFQIRRFCDPNQTDLTCDAMVDH